MEALLIDKKGFEKQISIPSAVHIIHLPIISEPRVISHREIEWPSPYLEIDFELKERRKDKLIYREI